MQFYTTTEVLRRAWILRAWKRKIEAVPTQRSELKNQLLTICNDDSLSVFNRYDAFITRKMTLLSHHHQQGWTWNAHFTRLWHWLSYLLPASWRHPLPGSQLRTALADNVELPIIPLLSPADYQACQPLDVLLNDSDYEEALLSNPAKAMADLKQRFKNLNTNTSLSNTLIERVHALKCHLDVNLYHQLLSELYQVSPTVTFNYFYQAYNLDCCETPEPQDFIEQYLMARNLISLFVLSHSDIHVRHYAMHYLLVLLSLNLKLNTPELQSLFNDSQVKSDYLIDLFNPLNPISLINRLNHSYAELQPMLRKILNKRLGDMELNDRLAKQLSTRSDEEATSPLQTLIDILTTLHPKKHPLLNHVARQCCEQLFLDHYQEPTELIWREGAMGFATIKVIADNILDTWSHPRAAPLQHIPIYQLEEQNKLLSPMGYVPSIPEAMKCAEKYAIELVLASAISQELLLDKARAIRLEHEKNVPELMINWIFSRLIATQPANDIPALMPGLKHVLINTIIYDCNDLANLPNVDHLLADTEPQTLLITVNTNWQQAQQAYKELDSVAENRFTRLAISAFQQSLASPLLTSKHLQVLFKELLPKLSSSYVTVNLANKWREELLTRQKTLVRWDKNTVQPLQSSAPPTDNLLSQAQYHYQQAHFNRDNTYAYYSKFFAYDFINEQEQSKLAVYYFAQYMDSLVINSDHRQAEEILNSLRCYLHDQQFSQWQQQLNRLKKPLTPPQCHNTTWQSQSIFFAFKSPKIENSIPTVLHRLFRH